jgi:iron complex outermembrane receptor protein
MDGVKRMPDACVKMQIILFNLDVRRDKSRPEPKRCWRIAFLRRSVLCAGLAAGALLTVAADEAVTNSPAGRLADLSLEQLMNEPVTSVSKKAEKLNDAPAAIYVISNDDIRRLGLTSIPEALRMVPGMDVAQINSHEWAVSARGFNGQFANKLLVLVDGRSVYGTGFGGVVWGVQDMAMEDLDRIEVIRGPGGTLWGANAMNGVINILTKSARETQGALVTTTVGTDDLPATTVRYGGQFSTNLYYRAYVKYFDRDGLETPAGQVAPDNTREMQGGFRLDWEPADANQLTLQGDYYYDRATENQDMPSLLPPYSQNFSEVNDNSGGNVLGRWTHQFSESSSVTLQTYYDHLRQEQALATDFADTIDFDAQHRFALGDRNDVVWGLGYRHLADKLAPSFFVSWNPVQHQEQLFSAFVQDEVTLFPDRLKLTAGSKFEHNDYTGFEVQPNVRLLWTPTAKQTVWAAVSRAVRTPSRFDLDGQANLQVIPPFAPNPLPALVSSFGNPNLKAEDLIAYELGYRIEITRRISLDATAFYNDYDRLIATVPGTPVPVVPGSNPPSSLFPSTDENTGPAQTHGMELSARWNVIDNWHLIASYSWLHLDLDVPSPILEASPEHQVQLRSEVDLPGHLEFNGAVYYVDQIAAPYGLGQTEIPAYVRLDLGLVWHPTKSLEIGLWGQNLLADRHAEFTSYKTSLITEIPRGVLGKITWKF